MPAAAPVTRACRPARVTSSGPSVMRHRI
jgi:hypothetical protein